MYKLVILPLAKLDIKEAADWYNLKQRGLGKRFTRYVRESSNYIKANPKTIATRYDDVKTAVLDVFPFMIHYSLDETNGLVIVHAVLHTSRNPDIWTTERDELD